MLGKTLSRFVCAVSVCFFLAAQLAVAQERFSQLIEDLPLAPGLVERTDQSIVFDKPSGRLIELMAVSDQADPAMIYRFYERSLPPLGWQRKSDNIFSRQGERLKISAEQADKQTVVIFALSPE